MAIVIRRSAAWDGISAILLVGAATGLFAPARADDQNYVRSGGRCHAVFGLAVCLAAR